MIQTMKFVVDIKARKAINLARLRKEYKLRQRDIAEMINAKESNVSEMERGKRTISERVINILCRKLKVDPGEFYFSADTPFVTNLKELTILRRLRSRPEIFNQMDVISKALADQYKIKGDRFRQDTSIPKKGRRKKGKTVGSSL